MLTPDMRILVERDAEDSLAKKVRDESDFLENSADIHYREYYEDGFFAGYQAALRHMAKLAQAQEQLAAKLEGKWS